MGRTICLTIGLMLLMQMSAWAVTRDEIPYSLKSRLPEFVLLITPPELLAPLSLADLEEYAEAYERGELRFVNEVEVMASSGPIEPDFALLMLNIPPGAPFVEERLTRLAKGYYGQLIFTRLEWESSLNSDGSVDLRLWYASSDPSFWVPDLSYDSLGGILYGAYYQDMFYGQEDKQLTYGLQFNEEAVGDLRVHASLVDNTLNGGRNSLSLRGAAENDWRQRLRVTPEQLNFRQRNIYLEADYGWRDALTLNSRPGNVFVGGGYYSQDFYAFAGDATGSPRSKLTQSGAGGFLRAGWLSNRRDHMFTPTRGYDYSFSYARHAGSWHFGSLRFNARRYFPERNLLGHDAVEARFNAHNDVTQMFPGASFAVEVQGQLMDGEVPYSREIRLGDSRLLRGYSFDTMVGTKLLAARGEYRFSLNARRDADGFVFSDHAWIGEQLDALKPLHAYGAGLITTIPVYEVKLGAYVGSSYDGTDSTWGLAFGYQF